jgi:hypothetical protein
MIKAFAFAVVALSVAVSAGNAFAQSDGKHRMWKTPYKAAPYAVWHDNATCPNPPAK